MKYRFALNNDIPNLVRLINNAYRNNIDKSWTNETQYVSGSRITQDQLFEELNKPGFLLMVIEGPDTRSKQLIACIGITFYETYAEIGTFCIDSSFQQAGIGKTLLGRAEQFLQIYNSNIKAINMYVLNVREELIQYYERRGYKKTGLIEDYPLDANLGMPLLDLNLIEMQKTLI
ncbi:GNAT family N-acetyltransferase [Acinetobacter gerneri]|uniref:GNAT family N-acetyltransferase n=1 Tax=Acinetobacter gerneri TaxID=202952 RepID=UPI003AF85035